MLNKYIRFIILLPFVALAPRAAGAAVEPGWVSLFDGQTLRGWQASENPGTFKVVNGTIAADGPRAHLFYMGDDGRADFKNFEFKAEVMTRPGANSGIYFHTAFQAKDFPAKGFEAQLNNSATQHGNYLELKKTGSLYGVRNVYKAVARDDEWFTLHITVRGRRVQIRVNDALLVDLVEAQPPVIDAREPGRVLSHGTFALQGHDPDSKVFFRNLRAKRLPNELAEPVDAAGADNVARQIVRLGSENFPLVDFHTHLKGGLTLEEALAHMRQTGINHGVAVNCGVGFAITNDAGIEDFLKSLAGAPCFVGMQAEGREWTRMFSPAAIGRFDYVFTDAMTLTDHRGQRARLWIPAEVEVGDKQAFMEMLVSNIVAILEHEAIDIYVNPTYLPDVIAADYGALWTSARMQKVVNAAARNEVAIEINSRFRLPSAAFIKMAKKAGVKFTLGTNNADRNLGRLEYSLEMVEECGLTWQNMWMPKPDGQKPIQLKRGR